MPNNTTNPFNKTIIEWLNNIPSKPIRLDLELNDNINNIDIETINNNRELQTQQLLGSTNNNNNKQNKEINNSVQSFLQQQRQKFVSNQSTINKKEMN